MLSGGLEPVQWLVVLADGGCIIGCCCGFVSPRDNRSLSPRRLIQFSTILDSVALMTGQRRDPWSMVDPKRGDFSRTGPRHLNAV